MNPYLMQSGFSSERCLHSCNYLEWGVYNYLFHGNRTSWTSAAQWVQSALQLLGSRVPVRALWTWSASRGVRIPRPATLTFQTFRCRCSRLWFPPWGPHRHCLSAALQDSVRCSLWACCLVRSSRETCLLHWNQHWSNQILFQKWML